MATKKILLDKYYNKKILLSIKVINDILDEIIKMSNDKPVKMLVFGLGYDSELWYNATNCNTYFVENNIDYINYNNGIKSNNIIFYEYKNINVEKSYSMTDDDIELYNIPNELIDNSPYDIILIDGPVGHGNNPGRLIPYYWTKKNGYQTKIQ